MKYNVICDVWRLQWKRKHSAHFWLSYHNDKCSCCLAWTDLDSKQNGRHAVAGSLYRSPYKNNLLASFSFLGREHIVIVGLGFVLCVVSLSQWLPGQTIKKSRNFILSRLGLRSCLKNNHLPQERRSEAGTRRISEDKLFQNTEFFKQMPPVFFLWESDWQTEPGWKKKQNDMMNTKNSKRTTADRRSTLYMLEKMEFRRKWYLHSFVCLWFHSSLFDVCVFVLSGFWF